MFSCLTIILEAGFEFTFSSGNYETAKVRESSSLNHIWYVVLVAWCVEDSVLLGRRVKLSSSYLDSLSLLLFFFGVVHDVGKPPGIAVFLLGFLFVLLDFSLIDDAHLVDNLATDS